MEETKQDSASRSANPKKKKVLVKFMVYDMPFKQYKEFTDLCETHGQDYGPMIIELMDFKKVFEKAVQSSGGIKI